MVLARDPLAIELGKRQVCPRGVVFGLTELKTRGRVLGRVVGDLKCLLRSVVRDMLCLWWLDEIVQLHLEFLRG